MIKKKYQQKCIRISSICIGTPKRDPTGRLCSGTGEALQQVAVAPLLPRRAETVLLKSWGQRCRKFHHVLFWCFFVGSQ